MLRALLLALMILPLAASAANRVKDNKQWGILNREGKEALRAKNYLEAERHLKKAMEIANSFMADDPEGVAVAKESLAVVYVESGQLAKAEKLLVEAMAIREAKVDEDSLEVARHAKILADVLTAEGKPAKAVEWYQKAVDLYFEVPEHEAPDHKERADFMHRLAIAHVATGKPGSALPLFPKSRDEYAKNPNGTGELEDQRFLVRSLTGQADALVASGKPADADPMYRRALALAEEHFPRDPLFANQLDLTARFLRKRKAPAEAAQLEARAKEVRTKKDLEE